MKLKVATCQFPVLADPQSNLRYVLRQMKGAKERGAHVAHFCEGALSGYIPSDLSSFRGYDWELLRRCTERVMERARELRLWVLLGSTHPLSRNNKPHNSVYVIDDHGRLIDRYDKRFCAGDRSGRTGELAHYSPGDHPTTFRIRGVECGVMICHEYRYPELFRDYKGRGVQLVFHSYHAGHASRKLMRELRAYVGSKHLRFNAGENLPAITMPATMQASAANSFLWISCANTSARESCWPAFFVRPDGVVTGKLRRNSAGVLISTVDTGEKLYDSTAAWRDRAMRGVLHSGRLVRDSRSRARTRL